MSTTNTGSSSARSRTEAPRARLRRARSRPEEVAGALAALGIRPSRRWGQSFLHDPFVVDAEVALLNPAAPEAILEIGGGLGVLTTALLNRGVGSLCVIERDPRLARHLEALVGPQARVVTGDAVDSPWPEVAAVVGNLPFSAAAPILFRVFESRGPRGVFLVQREVAGRLSAGPGSRAFGPLTVKAALYGKVESHQVVPANAFYPEPAVDGQLISFTPRLGPLQVRDPRALDRVVRVLFGARRKQLKHLLPQLTRRPEPAAELAAAARWPDDWPTRRPETLDVEAFFRLAAHLEIEDRGATNET